MRPIARRHLPPLVLLLLLLALAAAPRASGADEAAAQEATRPRVEEGSFHVVLERSGKFAPQQAVEVAYEPEVYGGTLEVVGAAPPGRVAAGDVLVEFDREDVTRDVESRHLDLEIARRRHRQRQEETRRVEEGVAIRLEQARMRRRRADEALDLFRKVDRPSRIEQSAFGLEGSEHRIQDNVEELRQLERMYEEDDLTEETEEIVLRRARRALERLRRSYGFQEQRHERLLEVTLPQEEETLVLEARRQALDLDRLEATAALEVEQARLALEKAQRDLERQEEQFEALSADAEALRLTAPADGYAVPGRFSRGKWVQFDETREALEPGGRVKARQVLYTIVRPGDVWVHCDVGEADLTRVRAGLDVSVRPGALPDVVLEARVVEVLPVSPDGRHDVRIALRETAPQLMPGMSCDLEIHLVQKAHALTVPTSAVHRQDGRTVVYVWDGETATEREVRVGLAHEGRTEVLEGLEAGEELADPPAGD